MVLTYSSPRFLVNKKLLPSLKPSYFCDGSSGSHFCFLFSESLCQRTFWKGNRSLGEVTAVSADTNMGLGNAVAMT